MPSNPLAEAHHTLVQSVARLNIEPASAARLQALGLHLTHICCEDSIHRQGAARGAEISDMTIQVQTRRQGQQFAAPMPVVRRPDFADRSIDLSLAAIRVRVGNHRGEPLGTIGLREYLGDLRAHLTLPNSWAGTGTSLLAARDNHVQLRAQACCLPVPRTGPAAFTPAVFNPHARPGAPAVLAILATREGTSATVVDNRRDHTRVSRRLGQHLLHNHNGQRASFTSAYTNDPLAPAVHALVLIQVPLRQPPPPPDPYANLEIFPIEPERGIHMEEPFVIDPRTFQGPYIEIDDLAIERDDRYQICVTVQFYRPTCEPVPGDDDLIELGAQIERVHTDADALGSLIDAGELDCIRE